MLPGSSGPISAVDQSRPSAIRYRVVGLTVLLAMVTYLDRACIGKLAPEIMRDLGLSLAQMGAVFSAFSLAYAMFEIPTAWWADRQGTRSVLTRIVLWWSAFTMATAGAVNHASLLATRFLFGAGEAGAWPCVARTYSRWVPKKELGTMKGIFFAGAYLSGGLTPPLVVLMMNFIPWRAILVCFGLVGLGWVAAWRFWYRDDPAQHPEVNPAELDLINASRHALAPASAGWAYWKILLRQRNVLALSLMYVPNCVTFYFCITWLPTYLHERHGFDAEQLGIVSGLPLLLSVATQFLGGLFSDRIALRRGLRAGRQAPGVIGYGFAAVFTLAAASVNTPITAAVLIAFATASCMLTTASAWGTCVDIGREHSAVVSATMNTVGQIGAIFSPMIVAYSVERFHDWNLPLYLLGTLFVLGAACWFFIDPEKPVFGVEATAH
jgi:ACS family glucarate transporter-like MFS transporter